MIKKGIIIAVLILNANLLNARNPEIISGKYKDYNKDYNEFLYFYNNKFYYSVNLCEFKSSVQGSFIIENNKIICTIHEKGFGRGYGPVDEIKKIVLETIDKNTIRFITDYGCNISKNKIFKFEKIFIMKVKIDNLRLREYANVKSKIVNNLSKGEKVEVINVVKEEVINSIKGKWVLIKTEQNDLGYCFDGYLE